MRPFFVPVAAIAILIAGPSAAGKGQRTNDLTTIDPSMIIDA